MGEGADQFWTRCFIEGIFGPEPLLGRLFIHTIGPVWNRFPEVLSRSKKIKRNFEKVLDEWRISVIIYIAVTQERLSQAA